MIAVLAMDDISFDEKPKMELVSDVNISRTRQVSGICDELVIDVNQFSHLYKAMNANVELMDNNCFFMKSAISKLNNVIVLEKKYLLDENIEPPTINVIEKATQLINCLAPKGIFPDNITTSAEEGICLSFGNGDETMFFELYNNGELGYIIENKIDKAIVENEDVLSLSESQIIVEDFYNKYEIS
ncbi:MAG: hypothetical protein PF517_13050 [Salinivirgaceae bacterium]|jgi:hypothetical protein|nr:hypothetical protein [Salinivirgaceae bacterium]